MAFERPTLGQLIKTAETEINALIDGADARLRYSVLNVFARVWAALTDGLYGALNFLSRQLFATTAEGIYLERIAESYGMARLASTVARGCVAVSGTAGAIVPAGTIFQRTDGLLYEATDGATIGASGTVNVTVVSQTAGVLANANSGQSVTLANTISGVASCVVCADGITGGGDEEDDEALRDRLLFRLRNPPGAGTPADWERWAREYSPSVTRVWVVPLVNGSGTVGVVFAQDNAGIVPSAADVQGMTDYLSQYTPVGVTLYVYAPTLKAVNFTVQVSPNTLDVRQAVEAELADLLERDAGPGQSVPLSAVHEAISLAAGEYDHTLVAPTAPLVFGAGVPVFEIGTLGTVSFA